MKFDIIQIGSKRLDTTLWESETLTLLCLPTLQALISVIMFESHNAGAPKTIYTKSCVP